MKLLLNISIPAMGESYDMFVPANLRVKSITTLIADACENLSGHLFISSGEERLCSVEKNIVLKSSFTLEKYGIQNGDHLMII